MDFSDPAQRAVFFDLHSALPREGPGDRASVARALDLARPLPPDPVVLDIACGPGGQTLDLAELLPAARITALDTHAPFLRDLERRAAALGVADRIQTVRGDMANLGFAPGRFDLLWCEGAAYIIGLGEALAAWRPLLKPGGVLALSEPVWLTSDPPEAARINWAEYPAMGFPAGVRAAAEACGYRVVGDFILDDAAWRTNYYGPLAARLTEISPRYAGDRVAEAILEEARFEIECQRRHSDSFSYVFIVLRA